MNLGEYNLGDSDIDDSDNNLPFDEIDDKVVNDNINPYDSFLVIDGKKIDKNIYYQFISPKDDKIKQLEEKLKSLISIEEKYNLLLVKDRTNQPRTFLKK
jgi:hypothetical protein